jgi:polysaccharide export outer membrane protein
MKGWTCERRVDLLQEKSTSRKKYIDGLCSVWYNLVMLANRLQIHIGIAFASVVLISSSVFAFEQEEPAVLPQGERADSQIVQPYGFNSGRAQQVPGTTLPGKGFEQETGIGKGVPKAAEEPARYILGTDDVIRIDVARHTDISIEVPISPDGSIMYPLIGEVMAGGLTKYQLARELTERLSKYYIDPQVTINVTRYQSKKVYVLGEVFRPGYYPMKGNSMTVLEAITEAGLPTLTASLRRVHIINPDPTDPLSRRINLFALLYEGKTDQNVELYPGDILYVPSTVLGKANKVLAQLLEPSQKAGELDRIYWSFQEDYWRSYYREYKARADYYLRVFGSSPSP